ncbi:hypothetical protein FHG87_023223 [Trinorchestia longiramus]|nr:hypothetical protein FHG87_023223 [Trinorchestia longiramus]
MTKPIVIQLTNEQHKVQTLPQKNVFLLVDEVQIRPTVSISGGLLSGKAENNRDCKATSILITRRQHGRLVNESPGDVKDVSSKLSSCGLFVHDHWQIE